MFNLEQSLLMCFIYLPPENSHFYRNTEISGIKCLENQLLKPEFINLGANLIIKGDLNARVAERDDDFNDVHIVSTLRNYEKYLQDETITKRISSDKNTNKKISNDQELIQSDPTPCPQNQKGNN